MDVTGHFPAEAEEEFSFDATGYYTSLGASICYFDGDLTGVVDNNHLTLNAFDQMTSSAWVYPTQASQLILPPQSWLPSTNFISSPEDVCLSQAAWDTSTTVSMPADATVDLTISAPMVSVLKPDTSDDWVRYKNIITKLYDGQNYTLPQVMAEMKAKHGFRATEKMYKDRFNEWGLRKHIRKDEAEEIVRISRERAMAGKPTQIFRRGRRLDERKIHRHTKGTASARETGPAQSHSTRKLLPLAGIRLSTPPPPLSLPPSLQASEEMHALEQFFFNAEAWINGNFESGTWTADPQSGAIRGDFPARGRHSFSSHTQFHALYYHASISDQDVSTRGGQVCQYFDQALCCFQSALKEQDPELLWELLYALVPQGTLASSRQIYRHARLEACLAGEACKVLGSQHPVTKMVGYIVTQAVKLNYSPARDLIHKFAEFTSLYFDKRLGKLAPISLIMRRRSVRLARLLWSRDDIERIQYDYLGFLADVDAHAWKDDYHLSQIVAKTKLRLAAAAFSIGEGEDARRWTREASVVITTHEDPSKYSLFLLGLMEKKLGNRKASLAALFKEMELRLRSSIQTGIMNNKLFVHPKMSASLAAEQKTRCMDLAASACSEWGLHDAAQAIVDARDLLLDALQSGAWNTSPSRVMRSCQMGVLAERAAEYDNGELKRLLQELPALISRPS